MSTREIDGVIDSAILWWSSKKPLAYSLSQHIETPLVNTCTQEEAELAQNVSKYLRKIMSEPHKNNEKKL